jgi:hypothetical protein
VRALVAGALLHPGAASAQAATSVSITGPAVVVDGDRAHIHIAGLPSRSQVTIESYRAASTAVHADGGWRTRRLVFHAHADFWTDARGQVDLDHAAPLTGTYSGADPHGLLWSGAVAGHAPEADLPADLAGLDRLDDANIRIVVRTRGGIAAMRDLHIVPWTKQVRFTTIATPEVTGVFAAPAGARHRPTVIVLHGSEGGDLKSARDVAGRFASHGYAALALIYFAWPDQHLATVPHSFTNLPVERLRWARAWLSHRPQAAIGRLGVVGGSKGAEFALLGAATYPWLRAVVACAPSSVVWGGFGGAGADHPASFLLHGRPLAAIPYGDYGPVARGEITSAERHRRDRAAAPPDLVASAAIPIARSPARFMLISGGRDAVWPSDAMSAELVARSRPGRVTWRSFPDAGHYLCGTGSAPIRANEGDEAALGGGLVSADGRDPGLAWEATLVFLRRALAATGTFAGVKGAKP